MRPSFIRFVSVLCAASAFAAPLEASAQTAQSQPSSESPAAQAPPRSPAAQPLPPGVIILPAPSYSSESAPPTIAGPIPASAYAANGEYVAPMSQTTQPTYIPQSVALSGPREIGSYEEGDRVPSGYHTETRVRRGLIVGGAVTFGVLYLFSVLAAAQGADEAGAHGTNRQEGLYAPVVGPFIPLATAETSTGKAFLFIDGLGQVAGAAMLIGGLTSTKTVLVRNDLGSAPQLVPMRVGKDGMGFGLSGSF